MVECLGFWVSRLGPVGWVWITWVGGRRSPGAGSRGSNRLLAGGHTDQTEGEARLRVILTWSKTVFLAEVEVLGLVLLHWDLLNLMGVGWMTRGLGSGGWVESWDKYSSEPGAYAGDFTWVHGWWHWMHENYWLGLVTRIDGGLLYVQFELVCLYIVYSLYIRTNIKAGLWPTHATYRPNKGLWVFCDGHTYKH